MNQPLPPDHFASVWDAIADTTEEAAHLRLRSELMDKITALNMAVALESHQDTFLGVTVAGEFATDRGRRAGHLLCDASQAHALLEPSHLHTSFRLTAWEARIAPDLPKN